MCEKEKLARKPSYSSKLMADKYGSKETRSKTIKVAALTKVIGSRNGKNNTFFLTIHVSKSLLHQNVMREQFFQRHSDYSEPVVGFYTFGPVRVNW